MSRSTRFFLGGSFVLLILAVLGSWGMRTLLAKPLPILGMVPEFALTDTSGSVFESRQLAGKVWVADFIFTRCAGPCPLLSSKMATLQTAFAVHPDFHLISISVDPERDTPEVLLEYAKRYQANPQSWTFLTGKNAEIQNLLVKGLKIGSDEEPIYHSTRFVLVDGVMRIRGYYDGTETAAIQRLKDDIHIIFNEDIK
jgi:protein SCO1/2